MIKSSSIVPRLDVSARADQEAIELRPRLAARRESPPMAPAPLFRAPSPLRRTAARPFGGNSSVSSVRTCPGPEVHRRNVIVVARKVLTPQGARRILLWQAAYIQRGAAESGAPDGVFFDAAEDQADPRAFVKRCQNDRMHYRLTVNPQDGTELGDLKAYARRFMDSVAEDLGGDLDWIAGAHFNTGRPHLHIMMRCRQASGQSLRVPGAYLSSGMRDRAQDVATEILGPRAERARNSAIKADRLTPLDRAILQSAREGRLELERIEQAYQPDTLRRLKYLETRSWATPIAPGIWRLSPTLRQTLLQAGQLHAREIAAARILEHSAWRDQRSRLEAVSLRLGDRLTGAYVGVHRAGRYPDGAHAVVLDLTDGRLAHVLMRNARSVMCLDQIPDGAVIGLVGASRGDRRADEVIAQIATGSNGIWSAADHAAMRPADWPRFIALHERRAQAMSAAGACTDLGDGRFRVPADYLSLAGQADIAQWGEAEPRLRVLDNRNLEEQVSAPGLTWLDRLMTKGGPRDLSGAFGDAVDRALPERAKRLRHIGVGSGEPMVLNEADIHRLRTLEIKSVFESLGGPSKAVFLIASGQGAAGVYVGRTHIAGAPYAVLEDPAALNLVPWSPGMEACRGRTLNALVQDGATTFRSVRSLGRDLGLG